jgi:hypothetical protein
MEMGQFQTAGYSKYPKLEIALARNLHSSREMAVQWVLQLSDSKWNVAQYHIVIVELRKLHRHPNYRSDIDKLLKTPGFKKLKNAVRNGEPGQ